MIKLSIVVPVYNTYNYLEKCLKSLINQKNVACKYEIIVVNDGSPDNSEKIILKYQKKYPELITYVKKENGGLSSARNEGLKHSHGEYVLFIDSDDYVSENLISFFMEKNDDFDLFVFGYNTIYDNSEDKQENYLLNDITMLNIDNFRQILSLILENKSVRGYAWNKIFKRKIIIDNKIYFDESIKYIEDLPFAVNYISKCRKVYFSSSLLYNYLQREGSLVNSNFNLNKLTALKAYNDVENIIFSICKEYLPTFYYFIFELNYELSVRIKISKSMIQYKKEYKMLKKNMWKYFKKFIFKKVKLKYKVKALIKLVFYKIILMRY